MARLRVAACQLNPVVGDLDGNVARMVAALEEAEAAGADMAVFPELVITGYPPEDLLLKPGFIEDNLEALEKLAARTGRCAAVVGFVAREDGGVLRNAAAICAHGTVHGVYHKRLLPNYAVFDEERYFEPGDHTLELFLIGGVRCGVSVCEDAWRPAGPLAVLGAGGAELLVNINASPYYAGRLIERAEMLQARTEEAGCPILYVNCVGGQDELVFDGASLVVDSTGAVIATAPQFREAVVVADLEIPTRPEPAAEWRVVAVTETAAPMQDRRAPVVLPPLDRLDEVYEALVLGTHDYVSKNGFHDVLVGMSGGIDSSLVTVIAVDALGPDHVHGVSMPSRFSSSGSMEDAAALADALDIDFRTIAIEPAHAALLDMLAPSFVGMIEDITEENLQSRIRGVLLMALSNKHGWLVLTTGNKSEMAVGYSTLYGDTAGGFAVIKDVPKTLVFDLARRRNQRAGRALIPESVLTKAPSAELRPDQRDDQSLPAYEVLDPILEAYVEKDMTSGELVDAGFDPELVRRVVRMVDLAEYKRRQTPPGVRVTPKAFGKDRRVPITNRYRG